MHAFGVDLVAPGAHRLRVDISLTQSAVKLDAAWSSHQEICAFVRELLTKECVEYGDEEPNIDIRVRRDHSQDHKRKVTTPVHILFLFAVVIADVLFIFSFTAWR